MEGLLADTPSGLALANELWCTVLGVSCYWRCDKGKPVARWGRKAKGSRRKTARPPNIGEKMHQRSHSPTPPDCAQDPAAITMSRRSVLATAGALAAEA